MFVTKSRHNDLTDFHEIRQTDSFTVQLLECNYFLFQLRFGSADVKKVSRLYDDYIFFFFRLIEVTELEILQNYYNYINLKCSFENGRDAVNAFRFKRCQKL